MRANEFFQDAHKLFLQGRYEDCIAAFSRALEAGYNPSITYLSRGSAYLQIDETGKAMDDFTSAILLDDQNEKAYCYRAIAAMNMGDFERAVMDLTDAVDLNPEFGSAFFARAISHAEMGNEDFAIGDFEQALSFSETELQNFASTFVVGRPFDRTRALLRDEKGILTKVFTQEEIEKLREWMD